MPRSWLPSFLIFLFIVACANLCVAGQERPHPATTESEKRLDRIVRQSEKDQNLVEFVLRTPAYKPKADKGYAGLFTKRLLDAMAARERAAVAENCKGKYIPGELCGLDYNPLTCAQDEPDGPYLYTTQSAEPEKATIVLFRPGEKKPAVRYEMTREAGQWKLDAVRCLP